MNTDKQTEVRSTIEALSTERALKLALEALLSWGKGFPDNWGDLDTEAITALRERLAQPDPVPYWHSEFLKHNTTSEQPAQPEQEPVAMHEDWYDSNSCGHCGMVGGHASTCRHYKPTSPPASPSQGDIKPWVHATTWRGLTDKEIEQCMKQAYATVQGRNLEHAFAHAIEAKLRERNEHREKNS